VGTLLCAVALAVAAYQGWDRAAAEPVPVPRYGAVELSDAVLFDTGPAARHLAPLGRPPVTWSADMHEGRRAVTEAIARNPQWSEFFASRLQSGDPVRVDAAVRDLAALARAAYDRRFGVDVVNRSIAALNRTLWTPDVDLKEMPEQPDSDNDGLLKGTALGLFLGVFVDLSWNQSTPPAHEASLAREQLVRDLAVQLRAG
jgi:hypothetical protein